MHGEASTNEESSGYSRRSSALAPHVSVGLLACATVSTAHWLGTEWVAQGWLGLPLGVWVVGAAVGGAILHDRRTHDRRRRPVFEAHDLGISAGRLRSAARAGVREFCRRYFSHPIFSGALGDRYELGPELLTPEEQRTSPPPRSEREERAERAGAIGRIVKSDGTPRIGVSGPDEYVQAFVERAREEAEVEARFEPVPTPVREPEECAKRALAGAVNFGVQGETAIVVPETKGREAAWSDWSQRLALSYPATFPPRVDPARISCGVVRPRSVREARLVVRMAEAAAVLGQLESRTGARRSAEWLALHEQRATRSMAALARTLATDWATLPTGESAGVAPACRATARAASAWLTMYERTADPRERRALVETCAAHLTGEPEAYLRLAAARIGAFEDDEAVASLRKGFETLRASGEVPMSDPLAFVMAEMEVGSFSSLALGRVAAGLAIAWATTPEGSLDYLREDLLDDLRYAGRLVGRDQDHAFLKHVMAYMDRLRSESIPLRVRAA
jgi:hypothetical protein